MSFSEFHPPRALPSFFLFLTPHEMICAFATTTTSLLHSLYSYKYFCTNVTVLFVVYFVITIYYSYYYYE